MSIAEIMKKLKGLSQESLVLWRQVLDQPVQMPFWEARSKPVQDLVKIGLVWIIPGTDLQTYTADLSFDCATFRFSDVQRKLLTKMSEGPLAMKDYLPWATENGIKDRLSFMRDLTSLGVIQAKNMDGGVIFHLM